MSYLTNKMKSEIPVVLIHKGSQSYVQSTINKAKSHGNTVVLIGDHKFDGIDEFYHLDSFASDIEFVRSFYIHKSTNPYFFELFCIARWFILKSFLIRTNRNIVYYSDSDVFLYFQTDNVYPEYSSYDTLYTSMYDQDNFRWSASACCSFWKRETLIDFTNFVHTMYTKNIDVLSQKEHYHRSNKIEGGVCDMTLLYLFSKNRSFFPINCVLNGNAFDQNVRDNDNYYKDEYSKSEIKWQSGIPYLLNRRTGEWIRFYTLVEYAKFYK